MDYRDYDKLLAYQKVDELEDVIEDELFDRGYMFYDEFHVSTSVARCIPNILNGKYPSDDVEFVFMTLEEDVEDSGYEGLIYNTEIIDDRLLLSKILHKHYKNQIR